MPQERVALKSSPRNVKATQMNTSSSVGKEGDSDGISFENRDVQSTGLKVIFR